MSQNKRRPIGGQEILSTIVDEDIERYLENKRLIKRILEAAKPGDRLSVGARHGTRYLGTFQERFDMGIILKPGAVATYWDGGLCEWDSQSMIDLSDIFELVNYGPEDTTPGMRLN